MIFGNPDTNQSDAAASGSFVVSGSGADPDPAQDASLSNDVDSTTVTPTVPDPAAPPADAQSPASSSVNDAAASLSQDDGFSTIIAPADRDVPAIVHASAKTDLISNDASNDDEETTPIVDDTPPVDDTVEAPEELLDLKQQALNDLGPLVDHLDQSPEEKFRTTMMLIQSTDNSSLIKEAYAAAQAITDDKTRAQALLDVINEINYFTQRAADQQD